MKWNFDFTPAESLAFLHPEWDNGMEMMKFTMFDLLFKNVLELKSKAVKKGFISNHKVNMVFVTKGQEYSSFLFKPHESVFLKMIQNDDVELKRYTKKVYKHVKGFVNYRRQFVCKNLVEQGLLVKIFFSLSDKYSLTKAGRKSRDLIRSMIDEGNNNLQKWIKEEPEKAKRYLVACEGNVTLLEDFSIRKMREWSVALENTGLSVLT